MKRSVDRILTTHAGSLPRPHELLELYARGASGEELESELRTAVADVVRKQAEIGLDIVNDGEFGKPMSSETDFAAWVTYMFKRLAGYEMRPIPISAFAIGKDQTEFAEFYASGEEENFSEENATLDIGVCVGPIKYTGYDLAKRDIGNLKAGLDGVQAQDAILMAITPEFTTQPGDFYPTLEDELDATAAALREEYKTITDAGINVQIDDPLLVNVFEWEYSESQDIKAFRKWAEGHIERVNHALEGIPEEMVRYHLCWGSWKGPHNSDLPLKEVADLIVKINASQYSIEAANAQHEHEWSVWKDVKLPDGRSVVPGIVSHKTNIIEHPDLVAERIVRFADVVGRENVIAGTDCGMGGRIHPQLAWAKLKALSDGAAIASKRLWS